jgi:hypothetical protein
VWLISKFIPSQNHSCDPNLVLGSVYYDVGAVSLVCIWFCLSNAMDGNRTMTFESRSDNAFGQEGGVAGVDRDVPLLRLSITARRAIRKNEELTISYFGPPDVGFPWIGSCYQLHLLMAVHSAQPEEEEARLQAGPQQAPSKMNKGKSRTSKTTATSHVETTPGKKDLPRSCFWSVSSCDTRYRGLFGTDASPDCSPQQQVPLLQRHHVRMS